MSKCEECHRSYADLAKAFREEGYTITDCGGYAPVQIEGTTPDGLHFYFRARHDSASVSLFDVPVYPGIHCHDSGHHLAEVWDHCPNAGWIEADTARSYLERLLREARMELDATQEAL